MSAIRESGAENVFGYAKQASSAITIDSVLAFNGSGYVQAATSSTAAKAVAGISQRACVSTDPDYAQNTLIPLEVGRPRGDRFIMDVNTADTIAQANVGTFCDLADALTIKPNTQTNLQVFIEKLLNTTGGSAGVGQAVVSFPGTKSA